MDNKLENMFFQFVWKQMFGSSIKEFVVKKTTNISIFTALEINIPWRTIQIFKVVEF
jgi:hypothetical protein